MTVNTAKFEESTEILVDSEVETADTGWTINYCSVNRIGNLVAVHVEATNGVSAAAAVLTLQPEFCPGDTVTDPTGNFTLTAAGLLSFGGSTASGAKRICQLVYQAGSVSP
jgi:hypothetical protein